MHDVENDLSIVSELLELLPDAIVWAIPVWNRDHNITDFEFIFSNRIANEVTGHPHGSLQGLRVLQDCVPAPDSCMENFQNFLQVYNSGQEQEYTFCTSLGFTIETIRKRFRNGVLSTTRDRRAQREAEQNEAEKTNLLHGIVEHSPIGIQVYKAERDNSGRIVNFRIKIFNKALQQITGISDEERNRMGFKELLHIIGAEDFFARYVHTVETGEPFLLEYFNPHVQKWLFLSVVKFEDGFLFMLSDTTEKKQALIQIEQQKSLMDSILKYSSSGIAVSEMIRDEQGMIVDARILLANEAAINYTGIPKELFLTRTVRELEPKIITSSYYHMVIRTLETGEPFHTQYFLESMHGWLEISISRMDNDHIIIIFTDITGTKEAQLNVEQAAQRLNAVFNAAQSGMFTFAPVHNSQGDLIDFRFVIVNKTTAAFVGQIPEKLSGTLGSTWFPGYFHNGLFDLYKRTYLTGELQRIDIHYNVDGHDNYLDLMSTKVGDEVLVTFTDYTPLKRTQLQLEKTIEELKRSNINLEEFAYAASHDLKEPIRKIQFFADKLKRQFISSINAEGLRTFERLEVATERMRSLVDDLLTYSQVSLRPIHFEDVDLNILIHLVMGDLELEIEERKAKITIENLPIIKGHMRQLQQVFQNLLSNALKYSKSGQSPEINIICKTIKGKLTGLTLSAEEQNRDYYAAEVSDNGIGFEQKDAERIFNVFQRLHGNKEYRGTGVGLSIVRKVVENHNGYITARSEPNRGSTFTVYLPCFPVNKEGKQGNIQ